MTKRLAGWPSVTDTFLEVDGRRVRALRADSRRTSGDEPQLLVHH